MPVWVPGDYAEKYGDTDWNVFELRMYDFRIARWLTVDPAGQNASPYVGMGADPVNGGIKTEERQIILFMTPQPERYLLQMRGDYREMRFL